MELQTLDWIFRVHRRERSARGRRDLRAPLLAAILAMGWGLGCGRDGTACRQISADGDCSCMGSHSPNAATCAASNVLDGSGVCCASPGWPGLETTCTCASRDYLTKYRHDQPPCGFFGQTHTQVGSCVQPSDNGMSSGPGGSKPPPKPKPRCTTNSDCSGCQRCSGGECHSCSIGALGRCSC